MKRIYIPRLEIVEWDFTVVHEAWQDWGWFDNSDDAEREADKIWLDVLQGLYDDRLPEKPGSQHLNVCIEIRDDDSFDMIGIYYDKDESGDD